MRWYASRLVLAVWAVLLGGACLGAGAAAAEPAPPGSEQLFEDAFRAHDLAPPDEAAARPPGIFVPGDPVPPPVGPPPPAVDAPFPVDEAAQAAGILGGGAVAALTVFQLRVRRHRRRQVSAVRAHAGPTPAERIDLVTRPWRPV